MWEKINRRKFPRVNYKCTIIIKSKGRMPKVFQTKTDNIGRGGICVVLNEGLDLFKEVGLEVALENGNSPVKCNGSVVWVVKRSDPRGKGTVAYDTGIEFLDIKEVDRERIGGIVDKILPAP